MLLKLTTRYPKQTQNGLFGLALCGAITALLFDTGRISVRATYVGASVLVFPVAFGMLWLILMVHIWIGIAPKIFLRFASNFFFICSIASGCIAAFLPLITKDPDQPGSSALMAASALGFGLASFWVYKRHRVPPPNAT